MSEKVKQQQIAKAVHLLKAGALVAFPTETVYGLGADASNPNAVNKIFLAKGRPTDHPLIVHLADKAQLTTWARDIPAMAWELAEQFWPGPLTLILKRADSVLDIVTGGQDTVGLRVPSHPIAQAILQAFGGGIVAPSANKFGQISPTQASHVQQELGEAVDLIVEGGACTVGIESTIVDLSSAIPRILRPGAISASQLSKTLHMTLEMPTLNKKTSATVTIPKVSGGLLSHYAPVTPLKIVAKNELQAEITKLILQDAACSVLAHSFAPVATSKLLSWLPMPASPAEYARDLYTNMRIADAYKGKVILVEAPPTTEEWFAIWDRLRKASAAKI